MRPRGTWLLVLAAMNCAIAVDACGSRTGFTDDAEITFGAPDGGPLVAPPIDGARRRDARELPAPDALPPIDARPLPDVMRDDCPDADATLVYVVTQENQLFSFYPPTATFTAIGKLVCPSAPNQTAFSMAVDRKGKAYVVYSDGNLYAVSTATAACVPTGFAIGQKGFVTFGMGFVSDTNGAAERLYIAENDFKNLTGISKGLATIDLVSFGVTLIAPFSPPRRGPELTGTGDGRLFGFSTRATATGSNIVEIDKATAAVVASNDLPFGTPLDAFAFAYWGGEFWVFTSQTASGAQVTRYRPSDGTSAVVTTHPQIIVGAGVSTCAPQ